LSSYGYSIDLLRHNQEYLEGPDVLDQLEALFCFLLHEVHVKFMLVDHELFANVYMSFSSSGLDEPLTDVRHGLGLKHAER